MSVHPEMSEGPFAELMKNMANRETVDVWCKGCNDWRKMNASYASVLKTGEIESCGICRNKK